MEQQLMTSCLVPGRSPDDYVYVGDALKRFLGGALFWKRHTRNSTRERLISHLLK